jgi:aspartate aminotransferase
MQFSDRIMQIKPSATLAVSALAKEMESNGLDVVSFGAGEPDFDTPENIKIAAIKAIEAGKTKYTPAGGISELKSAIVNKFKRDNNLEFTQNEVTVNCGGKHSFYNLMQVLINPGDEVIIPAPYWVSYPSIVQLAGGKPVIIESDDLASFKITPDQLSDAVTDKTKAVILNSPSNPTGSVYKEDEIRALGAVVKDRDLFFVTDDIYEMITYDDYSFFNSAMVSDELKAKTIILNGVSKTYSMTGWRIGYIAGDAAVIQKVEALQSQSTSNPCSIAQWAAVEAISGDQASVETMREAFLRRRDLIVNGLNSVDGITVFKPGGAFYVFPNISGIKELHGWKKIEDSIDGDSFSSRFTSYLLKEYKVAAVPGVAFGADNYIRLSFATSDDVIVEGLKRIEQCVDELR